MDLPKPAETAPDLTEEERRRAWFGMWFKDHGFLRDLFYCNIHRVGTQVWRSAQPGPRQLRKAKEMGARTILNLRGANLHGGFGFYHLERQACKDLGLTLIDFPIRSRSPLEKKTLLAAWDLFETLEYPVYLHCKSGADRAGFMSTLYLYRHEGMPLREAMGQLALWPYGHMKQAKTGVIDFFFETFLKANEDTGKDFPTWVKEDYDPEALEKSFHENWLASVIVNKILRRE